MFIILSNIIRQVLSSMSKFNLMKQLIIYFYIASAFLLSDNVYHIPIEGTIDLGLPPYIERSIKEAETNNAVSIIYDNKVETIKKNLKSHIANTIAKKIVNNFI